MWTHAANVGVEIRGDDGITAETHSSIFCEKGGAIKSNRDKLISFKFVDGDRTICIVILFQSVSLERQKHQGVAQRTHSCHGDLNVFDMNGVLYLHGSESHRHGFPHFVSWQIIHGVSHETIAHIAKLIIFPHTENGIVVLVSEEG